MNEPLMLNKDQDQQIQEPDDGMGFDRRLAYWLVVVVVMGLAGVHLHYYLYCNGTEDPFSCAWDRTMFSRTWTWYSSSYR